MGRRILEKTESAKEEVDRLLEVRKLVHSYLYHICEVELRFDSVRQHISLELAV